MPRYAHLIVGTLALAALACAQAASPITEDSPYQLGYAANMSAGDSFVNLTNSGAVGGFDPGGDICANIYVFAQDQQLVSCCSCPLTPNHLRTLSVKHDLISNTLTPGVPTGVTIALVATQGVATTCNASLVTTTTTGLVAWGTTIHALPDGSWGVGEVHYKAATLSGSELQKMTTYCQFIQANGSGFGICNPCRDGSAGAAKQ